MEKYNIDLVVHSFADEKDANKQKNFFADPIEQNKFRRLEYTDGISSTMIIKRIKTRIT